MRSQAHLCFTREAAAAEALMRGDRVVLAAAALGLLDWRTRKPDVQIREAAAAAVAFRGGPKD